VILAGDIGGTKTNLAVFAAGGRLDAPLAEERFVSHEHPGLLPLVERFLATHRLRVEHACVGVAGPVRDGRCTATNLPWVVDADELARALGIPQAWVINDLEATAYGLAVLGPADFVTLARGDPTAQGNACLIAAGTGLGEAGLYWDGQDHRPFACEGGHASFAPTSDLEIELLQALRRRWEHVSWERVCSGPGLVAVYAFLRDSGRGVEEPWVAEALRTGDPAAAIAEAARGDRSPLCARALDFFVGLYGAEAGNLALKTMATGGVYVGGGIAPRIVERLRDGGFMRAFLAKGRMRPLLEAMPVRVILNDRAALLGAARCAALRAR
jgi:glucokinase